LTAERQQNSEVRVCSVDIQLCFSNLLVLRARNEVSLFYFILFYFILFILLISFYFACFSLFYFISGRPLKLVVTLQVGIFTDKKTLEL
jgi:hypothetical protein